MIPAALEGTATLVRREGRSMAGSHPVVTVTDPLNGDTQTAELPPEEYVVLCGERRRLTSVIHHANGTVQITIKLRPAGQKEGSTDGP
jgi:hypothetical protein